jgi:hypothetical protein
MPGHCVMKQELTYKQISILKTESEYCPETFPTYEDAQYHDPQVNNMNHQGEYVKSRA